MSYKVYSKKRHHSYTWGAFPTFELIKHRPDLVEQILVHSKTDPALINQLEEQIESSQIRLDDALLEKLANRENVFVLGIFQPPSQTIEPGNHLVLDTPANFGNLGTMLRTALGLNYQDIALIGNACDWNHPSVIRAAMGAHFSLRIEQFPDFESYLARFPDQTCYALMGQATCEISQLRAVFEPFSLLLGNESRGLPESVRSFATPVAIAMPGPIDSYNITVAAGIALYSFHQKRSHTRP